MSADIFVSKRIYLYRPAEAGLKATITKMIEENLGKSLDGYEIDHIQIDLAHWRGYGLAGWLDERDCGDGMDISRSQLMELAEDCEKGLVLDVDKEFAAEIAADIHKILKDFPEEAYFRVTVWC